MTSDDTGRHTPMMANTAGELEPEARSRRFNLIEGVGMMTFVLVVLWFLAYPFGVLGEIGIANPISQALLTIGALFLLFVSPFIHRDTLTSWGLGDPRTLIRWYQDHEGPKRFLLPGICAVLAVFLAAAFYINWEDAARFLFRVSRSGAADFKATAYGPPVIAFSGIALGALFASCVIRYDNFHSAFWTALKVVGVLGGLLYLAAFLHMGTAAFEGWDGPKFALDVFGYVFWGALQQLLFSSYFGNRIRKGFRPAKNPRMRGWKRLGVATLNGAFFGIIHINSWYLVLVTWLLGIVLSWYFMEDKNRNLFALGFIHGFLGSSVNWLFSKGKAGDFEINMSVGPWNIDYYDATTMGVVTVLVLAFLALKLVAWYDEGDEPGTHGGSA